MQQKFKVFRLEGKDGMCAEVCDFGARLMSLCVPDRNGKSVDVLAGFDTAEEYVNDHGTYFGATIGRVANRIGKGRFELDGKAYELALNDNGINHLHGGNVGFDKRVWKGVQTAKNSAEFLYTSADGEEGYPGKLEVKVTFALQDGALTIDYEAMADRNTLCALTNHAYFNLDGDGKSVLDHEIFVDADSLAVVDGSLIPTGERADLTKAENAAFCFASPRRLGEYIGKGGELMEIANGGYDFSYNFAAGADASRARATAFSHKTGIKMSVFTDMPAMQFYTGNFLDGFAGKKGQKYDKYAAFCMETQGDIADFEQKILRGGETYRSRTRYVFEAM